MSKKISEVQIKEAPQPIEESVDRIETAVMQSFENRLTKSGELNEDDLIKFSQSFSDFQDKRLERKVKIQKSYLDIKHSQISLIKQISGLIIGLGSLLGGISCFFVNQHELGRFLIMFGAAFMGITLTKLGGN